jgi:hypothetical protein
MPTGEMLTASSFGIQNQTASRKAHLKAVNLKNRKMLRRLEKFKENKLGVELSNQFQRLIYLFRKTPQK